MNKIAFPKRPERTITLLRMFGCHGSLWPVVMLSSSTTSEYKDSKENLGWVRDTLYSNVSTEQ